jgi:stromal membrane-associated protein
MADQKKLKKRLKVLMQRPENQVCSDCPEKRPTWASLIVPPPKAPPGTEKIGAFTCLECSGSHRRLGVHISFVRSINLDSWKEWEVIAMENGGNAKVNSVFEANLAQSGRTQPTTHADGPTRERFIRDKYERRKFYDPAGFAIESGVTTTSASHDVPDGGGFASQSRPGAPSDIARRRVASRQARMKPLKSNVVTSKAPEVKVAQVAISAPVEFDLLDFGSQTTSPGQTSSIQSSGDLFSSKHTLTTTAPATQTSMFSNEIRKNAIPPPPNTAPPPTSSTSLAQELVNNPAPATKPTSNDDIMALFGPTKDQQKQQLLGSGVQGMSQMGPNNSVNTNPMNLNGFMSQQNQNQQMNMMAFNNQQNMMSQQRKMLMQNNNMVGNSNQFMQNQMMQNQMMQKQMMMQQQMGNQFQPNNSGAMTSNNMGIYNAASNGFNNFIGGAAVNNSIDSTIQGIQNMNMGNTVARQTNDDGGFGTPMGGKSQQQHMENDAFSSLGGMNAFR